MILLTILWCKVFIPVTLNKTIINVLSKQFLCYHRLKKRKIHWCQSIRKKINKETIKSGTMTMEERSSGIEDGAPVISIGASINNNNNNTSLSSSPTSKQNSNPCETTSASYPLQRTSKRSFDVAFLVAPDEKLLKRKTEKLVNLQYCTNRLMNDAIRQQQQLERSLPSPTQEDYNDDYNDRLPQNLTIKHYEGGNNTRHAQQQCVMVPQYLMTKRIRLASPVRLPYTGPTQSPSPPVNVYRRNSKVYEEIINCNGMTTSCPSDMAPSRSAFTKVNLTTNVGQQQRNNLISPNVCYDEANISPRSSSISPDAMVYQNSLSPPMIGSPPVATNNHKYKMSYPFLASPPDSNGQQLKLTQRSPPPKVPSPKIPPPITPPTSSSSSSFRPELPSAVYPSLQPPYNPLTAVFPPIGEALVRPRLLAAASLLPSSLAALALPAQNVCAKCNLSFRMTSDLVYHMRSHHKSEHASEAARRRREEKLRCPVCDESFRERHHLTRHMTAHQDKESDAVVDQVDAKRRASNGNTSVSISTLNPTAGLVVHSSNGTAK